MQVEISDTGILVDATLLGEILAVAPQEIPALMRERAITSLCESGAVEDEGRYRLSFFYRNRRARLTIDPSGRVLRRSVIDFGEAPMPGSLHRPG